QFKSYDSTEAGTYILDAGDYYITAAADAHKAVNNILAAKGKTTADGMDENGDENFTDIYTVTALDAKTYAADSYSGEEIHNLFDDAKGDFKYLTRNDWENTFPEHDGEVSTYLSTWGNEINGTDGKSYVYVKKADKDMIAKMDSTDSLNPVSDASFTDAPVFARNNGLELIQLRGKDYDDPMWDELLDQLSENDLQTIVNYSGYGTIKLESIQKPHALDADSATGLVFGDKAGTTFNGAEVTAQTWNIELAERFGAFIGNDALLGGIAGWYSPAMNIHRTPFSGRNNEYFSEDPFISGNVAAAEVREAAARGMYTYVKHFALNDQENHRGDTETEYGACTFANEQSIREIYTRPFEMCMKTDPVTMKYIENDAVVEKDIRACQAMMTAFNRLGYTWTGGSYNLIQGLVRNEWGFNGFIITDADTPTHMDPVQMIKAGADGKLNYAAAYSVDLSDPAVYHYAREAAHHFLYTIANSKAMNKVTVGSRLTGMDTASTLRIGLSAVSVLGLALIIGLTLKKRFRKA
ncbi:MAG: hypothetical protein IKD69_03800, partial [Solobacterium sp.]|nr:hypothetical protein [Solobacterium sp.]